MVDFRGVDHDPGWINRRLREIDRKIEALRSERRSRATTISDGDLVLSNGGRLVVDGGDVLLLDADGSVLLSIGPQAFGDRGLSIFRDDGSLALGVRKAFSGVPQTVEMRDKYGYLLVAEEALGTGLSRPYLHIPLQPVCATPTTLQHGPYGVEVPLTATSWTTTHQAWYARHNQYGRLVLHIAASDTTTAAEMRVINAISGEQLGAFFQPPWVGSRPVGSTDYVEVMSPALFIPGAPDERITLAVQMQRTAGAGTLSVALAESHGTT